VKALKEDNMRMEGMIKVVEGELSILEGNHFQKLTCFFTD